MQEYRAGEASLQQWWAGSRLTADRLQSLLTLSADGRQLELKLRAPADSAAACFYLMEDILTAIEQVTPQEGLSAQGEPLHSEAICNAALCTMPLLSTTNFADRLRNTSFDLVRNLFSSRYSGPLSIFRILTDRNAVTKLVQGCALESGTTLTL